MDYKLFKKELEMITDAPLRRLVRAFIEQAPDYIAEVPASSTGKHHPKFDSGKGGLVRHLKMCVRVADELMRLSQYEGVDKDVVFAACMLHDMYKSGYTDSGRTVYTHDIICASEFDRFANTWIDENEWREVKRDHLRNKSNKVVMCIERHMGQWGAHGCSSSYGADGVVQLADYIASRKFFDVEDIEWQ